MHSASYYGIKYEYSCFHHKQLSSLSFKHLHFIFHPEEFIYSLIRTKLKYNRKLKSTDRLKKSRSRTCSLVSKLMKRIQMFKTLLIIVKI